MPEELELSEDELEQINKLEESVVKALGEDMGFGRVMQLATQIWGQIEGTRGGQLTIGPCATFMVRCPHPGVEFPYQCDWCCGSGLVTKRVLKAMEGKNAH